jgi:HTH-type transcriptional regulator / antitoxin HigA
MADNEFRTPAQLIDAGLSARGWTQRILAVILGTDETTVSKIMNGIKPIDAEMALNLEVVLGIDPVRLLQLQKEYDLAKAQIEFRVDPNLPTRTAIFGMLPISDMIKRGWLDDVSDIREFVKIETALCKFFAVNSVDEIEAMPHAAKKTDLTKSATSSQIAWLYRVKQIAVDMLVPKYSKNSLDVAVGNLHLLRSSPEQARKVPRVLMESGVRFVIVESLPTSKIDGVCFWLDDNSPVVGMSLRFDRIDNFWFVLRHELEHVLRHHGRCAAMLDAELEGERTGTTESIPLEERLANMAAAEFCVSQSAMNAFIERKSPLFYERDILGFARTLKIHPGLIAGQLQHRTGRYDRYRNHLAKIRSMVLPGAMVDGWGNVASVGE